jgi:hypothetical protein
MTYRRNFIVQPASPAPWNRRAFLKCAASLPLTTATAGLEFGGFLNAFAQQGPGPGLKLKYVFSPDVSPIRASGATQTWIALSIVISNPTFAPITINSIAITIPVGQDAALFLAASANLSKPLMDTTGNWKMSVSGSRLIIKPTGQGSNEIGAAPLVWTLDKILVASVSGTVPITIVESYPAGSPFTDTTTYSLVKLPNDSPIKAFFADPAMLTMPGPAMLKIVREAPTEDPNKDPARVFTYQLVSGGWSVNFDNTYFDKDNTYKVATENLGDDASFTLNVIRAMPDGHKEIYHSISLLVPVNIPRLQATHITRIFGGRVAFASWQAAKSDHCSVSINDLVYANRLSNYTYPNGYPVLVAGDAGSVRYQVSVSALGADEQQQSDAQSYPTFSIAPQVSNTVISNDERTQYALLKEGIVAVPPAAPGLQGVYALAGISQKAAGSAASIFVVMQSGSLQWLTSLSLFQGMVFSPDGAWLYLNHYTALSQAAPGIGVVDVRSPNYGVKKVIPYPDGDSRSVWSNMVLSSDGSTIYIANLLESRLWAIETASGKGRPLGLTRGGAESIAYVPKANLIVTIEPGGTTSFFDLASNKQEQTLLTCGGMFPGKSLCRILVTSDGSYALACAGVAVVVDIAKRANANYGGNSPLRLKIPNSEGPIAAPITSMALVPNRNLAVVHYGIAGKSALENSVSIFDLLTGKTISMDDFVFPDGDRARLVDDLNATQLVVSGDGTTLIAAQNRTDSVRLYQT